MSSSHRYASPLPSRDKHDNHGGNDAARDASPPPSPGRTSTGNYLRSNFSSSSPTRAPQQVFTLQDEGKGTPAWMKRLLEQKKAEYRARWGELPSDDDDYDDAREKKQDQSAVATDNHVTSTSATAPTPVRRNVSRTSLDEAKVPEQPEEEYDEDENVVENDYDDDEEYEEEVIATDDDEYTTEIVTTDDDYTYEEVVEEDGTADERRAPPTTQAPSQVPPISAADPRTSSRRWQPKPALTRLDETSLSSDLPVPIQAFAPQRSHPSRPNLVPPATSQRSIPPGAQSSNAKQRPAPSYSQKTAQGFPTAVDGTPVESQTGFQQPARTPTKPHDRQTSSASPAPSLPNESTPNSILNKNRSSSPDAAKRVQFSSPPSPSPQPAPAPAPSLSLPPQPSSYPQPAKNDEDSLYDYVIEIETISTPAGGTSSVYEIEYEDSSTIPSRPDPREAPQSHAGNFDEDQEVATQPKRKAEHPKRRRGPWHRFFLVCFCCCGLAFFILAVGLALGIVFAEDELSFLPFVSDDDNERDARDATVAPTTVPTTSPTIAAIVATAGPTPAPVGRPRPTRPTSPSPPTNAEFPTPTPSTATPSLTRFPPASSIMPTSPGQRYPSFMPTITAIPIRMTVTPTQPSLAPSRSPLTTVSPSFPLPAPFRPPTVAPSMMPFSDPTIRPSDGPTNAPTNIPSAAPTFRPTATLQGLITFPPSSPISTQIPTTTPTNDPSSTPTLLPTFPFTTAPTASPSSSPTPEFVGEWTITSGPFTSAVSDTGYGGSLSMDGNILAAGAPDFGPSGIVQIYSRSSSSGEWTPLNSILPNAAAEEFGAAIDLSVGNQRVSMVVGAPSSFDTQGNNLRFGAAFYFELTGSAWTQRGDVILPVPNALTSNGLFGNAVAVAADARRIAVGAPSVSLDFDNIDNGEVYVYEFDGSANSLVSTLRGPVEGDLFGSSVALSDDGNRLLVGAPGSPGAAPGAIYYYSWNGSVWNLSLPLPGISDVENLGTSVAILADDGNTIAMGGPNFSADRGVVRVYQALGGSFWIKLGNDIEGDPGDFLGTSLAGGPNNRVVAGTANGRFRVYQYDAISDRWNPVGSTVPPLGTAVQSVAANMNGDVAIGLGDESVSIYRLR